MKFTKLLILVLSLELVFNAIGFVCTAKSGLTQSSTFSSLRLATTNAVADEIEGWSLNQQKLFLKNCWQRKPCMIKKAFMPGELFVPSSSELLELSVDDDVESRLLQLEDNNEWKKTPGPFDQSFLSTLKKDDTWTILVQEVDRHVPAVADIWQNFDFIPEWRRDDIMISYATQGGGIGAHVDNYDVFLIQGRGSRDWSIEHSYLTPSDERLREVQGSPTRLLKYFQADQTWRLEEGDMLYLPPRIPHRGVSCGDDCTTVSMGFRAPTYRSMMVAFTSHVCEHTIGENLYYTDFNLASHGKNDPRYPGSAVDSVSREAREAISSTLEQQWNYALQNDKIFSQWMGKYLTEPIRMHIRNPVPFFLEEKGKIGDYDDEFDYDDDDDELPLAVSSQHAVATKRIFSSAEAVLQSALAGEVELRLFEGVRRAYLGSLRTLFLNGESFPLPEGAERLASVLYLSTQKVNGRQIMHNELVAALQEAGAVVTPEGGGPPVLRQSQTVRFLCSLLRSGYYYPVDKLLENK